MLHTDRRLQCYWLKHAPLGKNDPGELIYQSQVSWRFWHFSGRYSHIVSGPKKVWAPVPADNLDCMRSCKPIIIISVKWRRWQITWWKLSDKDNNTLYSLHAWIIGMGTSSFKLVSLYALRQSTAKFLQSGRRFKIILQSLTQRWVFGDFLHREHRLGLSEWLKTFVLHCCFSARYL